MIHWRIRFALWALRPIKWHAIPMQLFERYAQMEQETLCGTLTSLSPSERQWLRQLNSGQYKLLASSIVESLSQPPPPLVPKDLTDAAREYVLFLTNCDISDEEKFRQAVAKLQRKFPQWKKRKLSLAIQLVINEK